jgi:DNA polymerase-3 subunit delta'
VLSAAVEAGRLPHTIISEGGSENDRLGLARLLARVHVCSGENIPCGVCPDCVKAGTGFHPDIFEALATEGNKDPLKVDAVREIRSNAFVYPNEAARRVFILHNMNFANEQAQNALLKILEEPPEYVIFLLLCESSASLLETVRSRAPTLRTEPISTDKIASHLRHISPEAASLAASAPEEFSEVTAAANGSIGRAIELLDPKRRKPIVAKRETARELIGLCSSRKSTAATARYLNALPQKREELVDQLQFTLLCLRDLLLCKQTELAPLCFFASREEACTLAYGFTTPQLLKLCDAVNEAVDRLKKSANVRLTLTSFAVQCGLI